MMRVTQLSLPGTTNSVSWTNKPISFYLHVVDRSKVKITMQYVYCVCLYAYTIYLAFISRCINTHLCFNYIGTQYKHIHSVG